jgi:hypothetical protein
LLNILDEAATFGQWALNYLQLFMYINIIEPNCIPNDLRKNDLPYLFDWKKVNISKFEEVFSGASFVTLLSKGTLLVVSFVNHVK